MEHRYSPRTSANMKVLIYKNGLPVAIGRMRNLSRHGLFIACDYGNFSLNQPLEIEFLGDSVAGDSHRRCRTMVVHQAADGFGLAIDDDCTVSADLISDLVARHRQRRAAFSMPKLVADAVITAARYP